MASAVTGTNTDKIDLLMQHVAALRTTLRIYNGIAAVVLPALGMALVSIYFSLVRVESDLKVVAEQLQNMKSAQQSLEKDVRDMRERLIKIESQKKS
jgi:hypothetical protein